MKWWYFPASLFKEGSTRTRETITKQAANGFKKVPKKATQKKLPSSNQLRQQGCSGQLKGQTKPFLCLFGSAFPLCVGVAHRRKNLSGPAAAQQPATGSGSSGSSLGQQRWAAALGCFTNSSISDVVEEVDIHVRLLLLLRSFRTHLSLHCLFSIICVATAASRFRLSAYTRRRLRSLPAPPSPPPPSPPPHPSPLHCATHHALLTTGTTP